MVELLRFALVTPDDAAAARRLACDVAREFGIPVLDQTKLATVVSELARRSLASAGTSDVAFSVGTAASGRGRLIVAVSATGTGVAGTGMVHAEWSTERAAVGLDLRSLRRLVDDFDLADQPGGGTCVTVAVELSAEVANDPGHIQRAMALRPRASDAMPDPRNVEPLDAVSLLESQAHELDRTNAELKRVDADRAAVNAELALTNRGVLDLIAELSDANESLAASGAGYRQLAGQQSALAELGHRAVASRDVGLLAHDLVTILRRVLGVAAIGVLRFKHDTPSLEVVATDGCGPDQPETIDLGSQQARNLRQAGTSVADLTNGSHDHLLLAVPDARSSVVVAVHTPKGPWGVLVACDTEPDSFTATTTVFLEAAASLFSFSIARVASEESAQHAAMHDRLTGLPNRSQLLDYMDRRLNDHSTPAEAGQVEPQMSVIFLDIDGFKQVNDTVGHIAGDLVLVSVAARLRSRTRPADVLARLGGDEFVVVCDGGTDAAAMIADRLLSAFDDPFVVEDREVFLSGSAGLALAGPGVNSQQILADADIAMYQAKQTPGSATATFHPEMRAFAESESRLHSELRRARERGELRAVFQPIFDLRDGTVRAAEALLRWRHPGLGDIPAERAVAVAASIGLAWDLTCWIAGEAARTVSTWNAANPAHQPLRAAVNFTPLLLDDPHRIGEFKAFVTGAGLSFDLLDVELTETAFADPTPDVLASMAELRSLGARLVMDDFGTGYSSLIALTNIPLDVLKIDRSFVTPLYPGGDALLVSAMTLIARGRNLETIGEGVETEGQLIELIAAGCDLGQGYLFAKPLEREELAGLAALESAFVDTVRRARLAALGTADPIRSVTSEDVLPAHGNDGEDKHRLA